MSKSKIDAYGDHLHGCECKECTKTNSTCPECGRKYWCDIDRPDLDECPRCMWTPFKQAEKVVRSTFNRLAAPFGVSI